MNLDLRIYKLIYLKIQSLKIVNYHTVWKDGF
jgi:hypothetical protein